MTEFAGTLAQRIIIERPLGGRTASGLPTGQWEIAGSCRAAIEPEGAGPESEAMSLSVMPRFRVTLRKRSGLSIDQRLRWGERVLMIRQVVDDPRTPDRIVLRCEEART